MAQTEVSRERLAKYFALTEEALKGASQAPKDTARAKEAADFLDMASRYHFESEGDLVTAFAAVTYAHAWLDAGARIGLFRVGDSRLFVVDEEGPATKPRRRGG